jgi:uncharacterized membrane protein
MEIAEVIGAWHRPLVHFPIALWIVAVGIDLVALIRKDERWGRFALLLLMLGTGAAGLAGVCGVMAQVVEVRRGISHEPTEYHERWAIVTLGWFVGLCLLRLNAGPSSRPAVRSAIAAALLAGLAMVVYTGYRGGELVSHYGAAVEAAHPRYHPTDESLQLLSKRQTMEERRYSNLMHHSAGVMCILLAAFLAAALAAPRIQHRVIRITPWLLVAGGVGLFIFGDTDAFPLSVERPFYKDLEVLFHKAVSFMMVGAGIAGLRKKSNFEEQSRAVGRSIGMLALAGGAILSTHIHVGAAYTDEAIGVYLQHLVMSVVAIFIGLVKFFEDRAWAPAPVRAYSFPALIGLEALLLLTYSEGMPWYTGREWALREGPRNGLLTQIGDRRAEMVFEIDPPAVHLYFHRLDEDAPAPVDHRVLPAKIRTYRETTGIELRAMNPEGSHFAASTEFLRKTKFFSLKLDVPGVGRSEFEPWSSWLPNRPQIAPPTTACPMNPLTDLGGAPVCVDCGRRSVEGKSKEWGVSMADYVCPEHPRVGCGIRVTCGLCGLWLEKNPRTMADDVMCNYTLIPPEPVAGRPVRIVACPEYKADLSMMPLTPLRGHQMHVDILGPRTAEHLHLSRPQTGCPQFDFTFPEPGTYWIASTFIPEGGEPMTGSTVVHVGRRSELPAPETDAVDVDGYRVMVVPQPWPVRPGDMTHLHFHFSRGGKPLVDLEPVEGLPAYCIVAGERIEFAHPMGGKENYGGPELRFHVYLPREGRYVASITFAHGGKTRTARLAFRAVAHRPYIDPGEK